MAGNVRMTIRKTSTDGLDFYPTQPWATRALLRRIDVSGMVWEPACGGGHMAEVLKDHGLDVLATDIHPYGYQMDHVVDFVNDPLDPGEVSWIITNPPFKNRLSERFVHRALEVTGNVAVLCRLTWLEGNARHRDLFSVHPPSRVIVMTERIGFAEGECRIDRGGMIPYAWFVWEEGETETRLEWLGEGTKATHSHPTDIYRFGGPVVE